VARLSEAEAREKLIEHGATTAASEAYKAHREVGGWSFFRRPETGTGLIGDLPYVVADNGKVAPKTIDQSEIDIIRRLGD